MHRPHFWLNWKILVGLGLFLLLLNLAVEGWHQWQRQPTTEQTR